MRASKRLFDVVGAGVGLCVLAPLFAVIALLVFLEDRGPVYFRQERVGLGGQPFRMIKFRTMVPEGEGLGPQLTVGHDPRVTRIGCLLRRTKLDELPQLLHVLWGTMSLVGPRPEVPRYVALYTPDERRVLSLTPGITDPASMRYRAESEYLGRQKDPERYYIDVLMREKIAINLDYASRATCWTDFKVVLKTVLGRGGSGPGGLGP